MVNLPNWTDEDEKQLTRLQHRKQRFIDSQDEVIMMLNRVITKIRQGEKINFSADVDCQFNDFNKVKLEIEYYEK